MLSKIMLVDKFLQNTKPKILRQQVHYLARIKISLSVFAHGLIISEKFQLRDRQNFQDYFSTPRVVKMSYYLVGTKNPEYVQCKFVSASLHVGGKNYSKIIRYTTRLLERSE